MASIQTYLNRILSSRYGRDVRQSIHDAIQKCYDDASVEHDNVNMEVKNARGTHATLNDRFVSVEGQIAAEETTRRVTDNSIRQEIAIERKRIDNLATLPEGSTAGDAELQDIRIGANGTVYESAGAAVRGQIGQLSNEINKTVKNVRVLATEHNNLISNIVKPCIFSVVKSDMWLDMPNNSTAAIVRVEKYNDNYALQTAYVFPSMQVFSRVVNVETFRVEGSGKWLPPQNYMVINPSDYDNLISNVTHGCVFNIDPGTLNVWIDKPSNNAGGIVTVQPYGDSYALQTYLAIEGSGTKLVEYNRCINTTTKEILIDWYKQNSVSQIGGNNVLYCIGDSITAGSYSNADGSAVAVNDAEWSYPRRIADIYGCTVHNLGVPGMKITEMHNRLSLIQSDATIVTITGGANDYYNNGVIGEVGSFDTTTICGALGTIIKGVAEKAPCARIVLISPMIIKRNGNISRNYKYQNFTYNELNEAMKTVADYFNVEFIDGTTNGTTNIYNIDKVQCDGVHPTKEYYATIANWLGSKLF